MTLDKKINYMHKWTRKEANLCWETYHAKYFEKHGGALHKVIIQGSLGNYIERECETFRRYAQKWAYAKGMYVENKSYVGHVTQDREQMHRYD